MAQYTELTRPTIFNEPDMAGDLEAGTKRRPTAGQDRRPVA